MILRKTLILLLISGLNAYAQPEVLNYSKPKTYKIAAIQVSGVEYLDPAILANLSGLAIGQEIEIPGDKITKSIKKYYKQGLFSDVKAYVDSISDNNVYLRFNLEELPRLGGYLFTGIKKSETEELEEKLELKKGSQLTESTLNRIELVVKRYFYEKGFFNAAVSFSKTPEEHTNKVALRIDIEKGEKVKIDDVVFYGNVDFSEPKLERQMKKTREKKLRYLFKSAKMLKDEYKEDKMLLLDYYHKNGYRDARIIADSIEHISDDRVAVHVHLYEGSKYYFGDIEWVGNTKYSSDRLAKILGIKTGDIYDQELLDNRLYVDEDAVSSLYLNDGYLFSSISPVEVNVESDSIDLEMRVYEGNQARINRVLIVGNTKTKEHVVRRELRTYPGDLFSKSDIVRSVRELAQLGHFDPEQINPVPIPNPADGTVDIKYNLVEKANDQLELSGGVGGGMFIGTLGVSFNNFAIQDAMKKGAWKPVPSGNGQQLSLRGSTNGQFYQTYSLSFMEPWLGGKKPNSFSVALSYTKINGGTYYSPSNKFMEILRMSVGLGRRLKWPDDYFTLYNELSWKRYSLNEYNSGYFPMDDGISNNISFTTVFGRNSTDQPIYPRRGANISISLELTPPYSLFMDKDYSNMVDADKYYLLEYHKWGFKGKWYQNVVGKLVLYSGFEFGYIGYYNKEIGYSPFETYEVGGDGWQAANYLIGRELVALRGYENSSLTPRLDGDYVGNIYEKFTMEFRYPAVMSPNATVYGLVFAEAGNCWYSPDRMDIFGLYKSAGVGVRAFLPMFGMLGVDWGYGFDQISGNPGASGGQIHFMLGQQF
jgi:outer membrane protein insertion porin family